MNGINLVLYLCERCVELHMTLIWSVPEQPTSHKKMRLAKSATVPNSSRLKPQYVVELRPI